MTKGPASEVTVLVRLGATLASGRADTLRDSMEGALQGADADDVEEILLQSYLFVGYPAALNALALWREVSGRAAPPATADDWELWRERGASVCERVYSSQYSGLRENVRRLHPDLERWMVTEGYGKVLGRPGPDLGIRELVVVAMLAVMGAERQLYSHLRGALNTGATEAAVEAALAESRRFTSDAGSALAQRTWARVRTRHAAVAPAAPSRALEPRRPSSKTDGE